LGKDFDSKNLGDLLDNFSNVKVSLLVGGNYYIKDTLSHPRKGYKFLRDKSFVGIDLDNIISTCTSGIKAADVILSVVVAMHHYFGELLMRHETLSYIQIHNIKKNELPEGLVIPEELRAKPKEYKYMLFYHTVLRYLHKLPNGDLFINNKDNWQMPLVVPQP